MKPDIPAFAIFSLLQRERAYRPPKMVRVMDGEKVLGYHFVDERADLWDRFLSYFNTGAGECREKHTP